MGTTKVEQLRQKYVSTQINIVDLVRLFDPTKNRLLTDLLMKEFVNMCSSREYEISPEILKNIQLDNPSDIKYIKQNYLIYILMDIINGFFSNDTTYYLEKFNKYWIENKIPNRDVSSYGSLNDIKEMVHTIDLEESIKEKSLRIYKMYDDAEWLVVLPLSFSASRTYGAGTKWCTTDKNEHSFYRYTRNGLLFYIINKKHNVKYAYHRAANQESPNSPGEVRSEFFDAADARVDSMDINVPYEILLAVKNFANECYAAGKRTNFDFAAYDREGWETFNVGCELAVPAEAPPLNAVNEARPTLTTDIIDVPLVDDAEMPPPQLKLKNINT